MHDVASPSPPFPELRAARGEMAERVRRFDWSRTPLGPYDRWPQCLRTAVGICLSSRFPMFVWWGDRRINIYNDAYIPILGKRHPAALGVPAQQTWHEIWPVVGPQADAVMLRGEATWNERVLLVMERNNFVEDTWFTWSYSPILDDAGGIGGLFCACTEETQRVRAEEAARDAERRYRAVFESVRDAMIVYTPEGVVVEVNPAASRIYGYTYDQFIGVDAKAAVHPEARPYFLEFLRTCGSGGEFRCQTVDRRRDGTPFPIEVVGSSFTYKGKPHLMAVVRDVTDRQRFEARDRFLVALDDAVRPLTDPLAITQTHARLLAEHLGADRCAYADVEPDEDTFNLTGDYTRGVPSIVGRYRFAQFGAEVLRLMRAGQPYVVDDIDAHAPPPEDFAAYRATMIQAVVCVPLHKAGRFVAAMAVHQKVPRTWRADEVELVQLVANRCWESIERARIQRDLEEGEQRLRTVTNSLPAFVWLGDPAGYVHSFNDRWYEYTGLTPAESEGYGWVKALHPDDVNRCLTVWEQSRAARENYESEVRYRARDGSYRWYLARATPLKDEHGAITGWVGSSTDIDDRRRVEQALRESEARFRNMADSASVMIWVTDADGHCTYLNRRWYEFTGQTEAEALGLGWVNAVHPDDRNSTKEAFLHANRTRGSFSVEYRLRHRDGSWRWAIDAAVPRIDENGNYLGYIGSVIDISDRKASEAERERLLDAERAARTEAERAGRMKDDFLATLSHELRTPLNAILGWSQILAPARDGAPTDPAELSEGLSTIARNARAQTQIIDDLLDMNRIVSGKLRLEVRRIDVADVLRASMDTVRPAAEAKGIHLAASLDPAAGPVSADPSRLQQVVWNLLSNAIKFTPAGGRVHVLLARDADGAHVRATVSDTGEGIRPDFLPHVFDRFRQADASTTRRHGGLGLGLSIAKQLVEMHGGTIAARSEGPGKGASFTVTLPATPTHDDNGNADPDARSAPPLASASTRAGAAADNPLSADDTTRSALAGIDAIVVDDEPDARALVRRVLESCGATVRTAASAAEAFELLASRRPDVLVSDIGMPGEDGYALIRRVRSLPDPHAAATPAVALTAYARAEDRLKTLRAGFQMHVVKPVEPSELLTVLASLVRRTHAR